MRPRSLKQFGIVSHNHIALERYAQATPTILLWRTDIVDHRPPEISPKDLLNHNLQRDAWTQPHGFNFGELE